LICTHKIIAHIQIYLYIIKMQDKPTGRGGAGRGQGRKPLKEGEESVSVPIRLTASQRDKLARLGGAQWVRDRIDKAKEPEPKDE
jgi:hypothetical protein